MAKPSPEMTLCTLPALRRARACGERRPTTPPIFSSENEVSVESLDLVPIKLGLGTFGCGRKHEALDAAPRGIAQPEQDLGRGFRQRVNGSRPDIRCHRSGIDKQSLDAWQPAKHPSGGSAPCIHSEPWMNASPNRSICTGRCQFPRLFTQSRLFTKWQPPARDDEKLPSTGLSDQPDVVRTMCRKKTN